MFRCSRWGVSTDLTISYLKPASVGQTIYINAECQKGGKTLAFCSCEIFNEKGEMILKGQHTKYMGTPHIDLLSELEE